MRKPKVKKRGAAPEKSGEKPIGHVHAGTLTRDVKNLERLQESRPLRPPGRV